MSNEISVSSSKSSLQELWEMVKLRNTLKADREENVSELTSSSFFSSMQSSVRAVNWMIENRGGFAFVTGLVMVPSQFLGPNAVRSDEVITELAQSRYFRLERFTLPVKEGGTLIRGIIYYPKDWDLADNSRAVVYHNPNGITVAGYFSEEGRLSWTPAEILGLHESPIIMYDYRGTGLSQDNTCCTSFTFRPTYESVIVDGEAILGYALGRFAEISVVGSSLGGGVATVSLDRHVEANPDDAKRVSLMNHDSFSTTPRVLLPSLGRAADWIGRPLGGLIDAESSMRRLVGTEIQIIVLCHLQDPVIPQGARMAEFVETLPPKRNVSIIYSSQYGHANLSWDMRRELSSLR